MTLPVPSFAALPAGTQPLSLFDQQFAAVAQSGRIECTASGNNTIALTPVIGQYSPTSNTDGAPAFCWTQPSTCTGPVTINVAGIGPYTAYKNYGQQPIASGDLVGGAQYECAFLSTLGGGAGGYVVNFVQAAGISDAPTDGFTYGRQSGGWNQVLPLAGGGMTGNLFLFNDPTIPQGAATKAYVDAKVAAGNPSGGSILDVIVSDTPPPLPIQGQLWWDSIGALLYMWYNDGNSSQWVNANNTAAAFGVPAGGTTGQVLVKSSNADYATTWVAPQTFQPIPPILSINGAMSISQELGYGGSTVSGLQNGSKYACDAFRLSTGAATGPAIYGGAQTFGAPMSGFVYGLNMGVTTAKASLAAGDFVRVLTAVEGIRAARLGWGAAGAQPVSIGFWAYCSIAGTITLAVLNAASNRSYIADVAITSNTWQWCAVTVPGDTTGTWVTDNTVGLSINLCLGCGSTYQGTAGWQAGNFIASANTMNLAASTSNNFLMTGFIAVPGSVLPAPQNVALVLPPYDQELAACQRYLEVINLPLMQGGATGTFTYPWDFKVQKRISPATSTVTAPTYSNAATAGIASQNADGVGLQFSISAANGYLTGWKIMADARL